MKTRPRLKALDMYATGYETRKGSPNNICSKSSLMLPKLDIAHSREPINLDAREEKLT